MKNCQGGSYCKCNGQSIDTKHFEIYSGTVDNVSGRFWGVVAYCKDSVQDEENKGYVLLETESQPTYTL